MHFPKPNPFSTHLRSVPLLRRRPAAKGQRRLCNPNKSTQGGSQTLSIIACARNFLSSLIGTIVPCSFVQPSEIR